MQQMQKCTVLKIHKCKNIIYIYNKQNTNKTRVWKYTNKYCKIQNTRNSTKHIYKISQSTTNTTKYKIHNTKYKQNKQKYINENTYIPQNTNAIHTTKQNA